MWVAGAVEWRRCVLGGNVRLIHMLLTLIGTGSFVGAASDGIPGITSGGLKTTFQQRGFTCDGPRVERTMSSWRCVAPGFRVEFLGAPARIEYITAIANTGTANSPW
jgi:hypothetical protein